AEPGAVPGEDDAFLRGAMGLEAVEAARVPEEGPCDGCADRPGAYEHDDRSDGDLQPSLPARRVCTSVRFSHATSGKRRKRRLDTGSAAEEPREKAALGRLRLRGRRVRRRRG